MRNLIYILVVLLLSIFAQYSFGQFYPVPLPGNGGRAMISNGANKWVSTNLDLADSDAVGSTVLPIANGGTNKALTISAGAIPYFDANSFEVSAVGTTGQVFSSAGSGTPTWNNRAGVAAVFTFSAVASALTSSSTTAAFATDAAWSGPAVTYNDTALCTGQTTDADGPRVTCNSAPAGVYTINFSGTAISYRNDTVSKTVNVHCSDGTTTYIVAQARPGSTDDFFPLTITCQFYYSSAANRSWDLRISTESGGTARLISGNVPVIVTYSPIP